MLKIIEREIKFDDLVPGILKNLLPNVVCLKTTFQLIDLLMILLSYYMPISIHYNKKPFAHNSIKIVQHLFFTKKQAKAP